MTCHSNGDVSLLQPWVISRAIFSTLTLARPAEREYNSATRWAETRKACTRPGARAGALVTKAGAGAGPRAVSATNDTKGSIT